MLLQKDIDPGSMTHQMTLLQLSMNPDKRIQILQQNGHGIQYALKHIHVSSNFSEY